jgi:glyoxylase-like metal-dependent hydrolase (beta-lactamase superfamily II)
MTAVCDRLHLLTLGHEHSPRWISIEGGGDELLRLPVIGILARAPAGWFLLETGIGAAYARDREENRRIYVDAPPELPGPGDPVLEALEEHGVPLGELAGVAVSHLHVDHAGGLRHVAGTGTPVHVQRAELRYALEEAGEAQAYRRADYAGLDLAWRELDGDGELTPGIDVLSTPGHTPGHMSYRVRMRETGTWLFAVDAIDLQEGIETGTPIGWSARGQDAPLRRASHDRLVALAREEGARLVPGHCPTAWPALRSPPGGLR